MKYSFTHHFAATYSLNLKLEQTDCIMIGLEEQSKRQDELIPKELIRAQTAKEGRRCRCWDVGSRVQISQSLAPASKGQRQTLWKPMVQTKKSPKQRLGFAQDLDKDRLQEIPFPQLGRFTDTCRGKDLATVADQGTNVYEVHAPCVQAIMWAVSTESFKTATEPHKVSLIFIVTMHQ